MLTENFVIEVLTISFFLKTSTMNPQFQSELKNQEKKNKPRRTVLLTWNG